MDNNSYLLTQIAFLKKCICRLNGEVGGGTSYTAGDGIDITGNVISTTGGSGTFSVLVSDDYADDVDAAMNGINIGEGYHTSGMVKIRLS